LTPRLHDPYAGPGLYRKAQLHCHTRRSDGRFEPADVARRYRDAGYAFVCFTDHNILTRCDDANDGAFLALPGVEETVTLGPTPLGPHLGRLFVDDAPAAGSAQERITRTLAAGGVPVLHHPSWNGNLWTGGWSTAAIDCLRGPFLVEVWNPHSNSAEDTRRWLRAVRGHGPGIPIGAVAADDLHTEVQFDRGWVVVKSPDVSAAALRTALLAGAFYASTGVEAEFGVDGEILVVDSTADEARVFDAAGVVRARFPGGSGRYVPAGDEEFLRVECTAGPRRAWSQVFWIMPRSASAMR
jgi:hypothetical protein